MEFFYNTLGVIAGLTLGIAFFAVVMYGLSKLLTHWSKPKAVEFQPPASMQVLGIALNDAKKGEPVKIQLGPRAVDTK